MVFCNLMLTFGQHSQQMALICEASFQTSDSHRAGSSRLLPLRQPGQDGELVAVDEAVRHIGEQNLVIP